MANHNSWVSVPYVVHWNDIQYYLPDDVYDALSIWFKPIEMIILMDRIERNPDVGILEPYNIIRDWSRKPDYGPMALYSPTIDNAIEQFIYDNEDEISTSRQADNAVHYIEDYFSAIREEVRHEQC